jgi:hypothetical protein
MSKFGIARGGIVGGVLGMMGGWSVRDIWTVGESRLRGNRQRGTYVYRFGKLGGFFVGMRKDIIIASRFNARMVVN